MSLRIHILPETPATPPLWVCAEVRLINPLTHPSVEGLVHASYSLDGRLPDGRIDVVVMQRSGWPDLSLEDAQTVVRSVRARSAKLVYDIDDDLLGAHPIWAIEADLARKRPVMRFLASEADLIICSTYPLADRMAAWPAQSGCGETHSTSVFSGRVPPSLSTAEAAFRSGMRGRQATCGTCCP